jgi:predicted nucleic acid-binding Zn ribbon protein
VKTPRERRNDPLPIGASLEQLGEQLGIADTPALGRVFARWAEIVGPAMADHVQPVRVDRDRLVVLVDHPAWATQVRHLGPDLLDRVAAESGLPRPRVVEVRVGR